MQEYMLFGTTLIKHMHILSNLNSSTISKPLLYYLHEIFDSVVGERFFNYEASFCAQGNVKVDPFFISFFYIHNKLLPTEI